MFNIAIVGYGNVGFHLEQMIIPLENFTLKKIWVRNFDHANALFTNNIEELLQPNIDIIILAINDDALKNFSGFLETSEALVCHTSGSIAMNDLPTQNKGVFYPFQTFSKNRKLDYSKIPFCLEANSDKNLHLLMELAKGISNNINFLNSDQRSYLHLAGVWVNNFVNHLYSIGYDIVLQNNIPTKILLPLIEETAQKVISITPNDAQTGPAIRNDQSTLNKHLNLLQNQHYKTLYKILSDSIATKYEKTI